MRRKVIIDCDPGIDDSLAFMLALASPELEVLGITIVCGNAPVEMGAENAKKVLRQLGRLDVPVYVGAAQPLVKEYVNALDTHGADGLGESFLEPVDGYEQTETALNFLRRVLPNGEVSVIALGPLTNLALLIQTDVAAFASIEKLVSMGGNYRSHGNCSPVAEYNYWVDPEAASLVFSEMTRLGKQLHMVGLDVTRDIVLTPNLLVYMERLNAEVGAFVRRITRFYFDFHWQWEHLIGCVINDPLAVAVFLIPDLCEGFAANVELVCEGPARGQTIVDAYDFYKRPANAVVYTQVDRHRFFVYFFSRVLGIKESELDLLEDLLA